MREKLVVAVLAVAVLTLVACSCDAVAVDPIAPKAVDGVLDATLGSRGSI